MAQSSSTSMGDGTRSRASFVYSNHNNNNGSRNDSNNDNRNNNNNGSRGNNCLDQINIDSHNKNNINVNPFHVNKK